METCDYYDSCSAFPMKLMMYRMITPKEFQGG